MISGMYSPFTIPLTINKKDKDVIYEEKEVGPGGGSPPLQFVFRNLFKPMSICFPNIPLVFNW